MNYIDIMDISATGLQAERMRMNVIAENIANAETIQTPGGGPYRRKIIILQQKNLTGGSLFPLGNLPGSPYVPQGVQVAGVTEDTSPLPRVSNPSHPLADADGYVQMPNVELPTELVDLLVATEAYEANAAVLEALGKTIGEIINLLQ